MKIDSAIGTREIKATVKNIRLYESGEGNERITPGTST